MYISIYIVAIKHKSDCENSRVDSVELNNFICLRLVC